MSKVGQYDKQGNKNPNYKHGGTRTKLYMVWLGVKGRCLNSNNKKYKNYGGRGITICPEWAESYIVFRDWALNNGYKEGLQINRIENDGNYEPTNCNFVTNAENCQNKRNNKLTQEKVNEIRELYAIGKYSLRVLAKMYCVTFGYVSKIINKQKWGNL